jgi:fructose-bisphosphate aldolase class I
MKAHARPRSAAGAREGQGVFGTKMRSVIKHANAAGIEEVVQQQFAIGKQILAARAHAHHRAGGGHPRHRQAGCGAPAQGVDHEGARRAPGGAAGDAQAHDPSVDDFYADLVKHPKVLRVVALSGGYSRDEADALLARNHA